MSPRPTHSVSEAGITVKPYGAGARLVMDVTGYHQPAMGAVVSSTGTLLYSSRLSVTSHTAGSGAYILTADTSVTSCSVLAAGWGSYDAAAYASGTSVYVNTRNWGTQVADAYFQVTITG